MAQPVLTVAAHQGAPGAKIGQRQLMHSPVLKIKVQLMQLVHTKPPYRLKKRMQQQKVTQYCYCVFVFFLRCLRLWHPLLVFVSPPLLLVSELESESELTMGIGGSVGGI